MLCEKCFYNKNCQLLAKTKIKNVDGCSFYYELEEHDRLIRQQAVKDTAKEIFAEIGKLCDQLFNGKILTQEFMAKYAELMKSKGVEVE